MTTTQLNYIQNDTSIPDTSVLNEVQYDVQSTSRGDGLGIADRSHAIGKRSLLLCRIKFYFFIAPLKMKIRRTDMQISYFSLECRGDQDSNSILF